MAGTKVLMAPTALMIHNPATVAFGDHEDMQKAIDLSFVFLCAMMKWALL